MHIQACVIASNSVSPLRTSLTHSAHPAPITTVLAAAPNNPQHKGSITNARQKTCSWHWNVEKNTILSSQHRARGGSHAGSSSGPCVGRASVTRL
jgi:hypothetical protein